MRKTSTFYSRLITVIFERRTNALRPGFGLFIHIGLRAFLPGKRPFSKGAGYIGGATLYAVRGGRAPQDYHRKVDGLQWGITRNAQRVPLLGEF